MRLVPPNLIALLATDFFDELPKYSRSTGQWRFAAGFVFAATLLFWGRFCNPQLGYPPLTMTNLQHTDAQSPVLWARPGLFVTLDRYCAK